MALKALPLLFLLLVVVMGFFDFNESRNQATPWMTPILLPGELKAMSWVRENTAPRTIFMNGIFGGEFLMGNSLRESVVGGDWAIIPNVVQRMHDTQHSFFGAQSSQQGWEIAKKYDAEFVWAPNRQVFAGYEWVAVNHSLFDDSPYFSIAYFNEDLVIYEVLNK